MAFTDLFQVPLVFAIVYSVKLSRRWGRAWKGIAVAFGGYTAWVVFTAFVVAFSPSMYLVVTLGTLLDPFEPMWKTSSTLRVWAIGAPAAVVFLWALPTGVAWLVRRREPRPPRVATSPPSWKAPAVAGVLLLCAQLVLFTRANQLRAEWLEGSPREPFGDGSSWWFGPALALTIPAIWLLAVAAFRWIKQPRSHAPAGGRP